MKNLSIFIVVMCAVIAVGFRWLPPDLKSPITHSAWFRTIALVFESDTRVMIADNSYPWRSIGLVHGSRSTSWLCTGFLIGPSTVATSRHCVMDEGGNIHSDLQYSVVRNTHYGRLTYAARRVRTIPPNTERTAELGDLAFDLAVFDITESVGEIVGHFGTVQAQKSTPSLRGSLAAENAQSVTELCRDTISKLPWHLDDGVSSAAQENGMKWVAPNPRDPPRICAAGYSGDLGYVRLSVAHACGLLGLETGVVIHNCAISNGASGGPLFYLDESGAPVAFATNTASGESKEFNDLFGDGMLSIGTVFTDLID